MLARRVDNQWAAFEYAEVCARQNGKALDVETSILTTTGWSTMGALQVGDEVFHPDGHPTRVVEAHAVMEDRQCYRVTTTDGRSVVADADHLWTVQDRRKCSRRGPRGRQVITYQWETLTTSELLGRGLMRQDSIKADGRRHRDYAYRVPRQHMVVSKPVELPIDPYLLGAWLGDGGSTKSELTIGDRDLDETVSLVEATGARIMWRRRDHTAWCVRIEVGAGPGEKFRTRCTELGVWGNKHVPSMYLAAGTEQRLALLQGLMDTDGSIEALRGQAEFCSTRRELAEGVLFLARSLGWRATMRESAATLNGREVSRRWRVMFTPTQDEPLPFRLRRKVDRVRAPRSRGGELHAISIASIESVDSRPVRCIKVDREDGLFLAGRDLMPTHNTAKCLARALAGMFLLNEQVVLWTAHEVKTSMRAWRDLRRLLTNLGTKVNDNLIDVGGIPVRVNASNGNEGFERTDTGQEIKIAARSKGSGRGFSVDCLIIDEAFAFDEIHQDALLPMLTARPNPQIVYASSPPLNGLSGAPMYQLRRRAVAGGDETLAYRDWGLAGELDELMLLSSVERANVLDDRERWTATNPALGRGRVSEDSILRLRRSMTERGFGREVLGLWPHQATAGGGWQVIREDAWRARGQAQERPTAPVCFAVAAAWPDAERVSIAVAGTGEDGEVPVWVVDQRDGTSWVPGRLRELVERWRPASVVLDKRGPAGRLVAELEAERIDLTFPQMGDVAAAAGEFYTAVAGDAPTLRHFDQPELDAALATASKRPLGDAWTWQRKGSTDISPLEAVTLARWGYAQNVTTKSAYDTDDLMIV